MRIPLSTVLCLVLALVAGPALAQGPPPPPDGGPPPGSPEWEEMMERIATVRIFKLTQALDLDEQTAIKLAAYLKDKDAERMEINAQRGRTAREIKEFLDGGATEDARAQELLTPTQQLQFVLANREFDREIREMIRKQRGGGRGGPPGH